MKTPRLLSIVSLLILLMAAGCGAQDVASGDWSKRREGMVAQLRRYEIRDRKVLDAMAKVKRHLFIPESRRSKFTAYGDHPCRIGYGQTISQPFIVAYMTEKVEIVKGEKVLEIGTGSGYQAAILAELGAKVYSIEIVPELAAHARKALKSEGYDVKVLTGDGYKGWPGEAPFDVIIVTCAPADVPPVLVDQLAEGGRMILPAGRTYQRLLILRKKGGKVTTEKDLSVRFVPMVRGSE